MAADEEDWEVGAEGPLPWCSAGEHCTPAEQTCQVVDISISPSGVSPRSPRSDDLREATVATNSATLVSSPTLVGEGGGAAQAQRTLSKNSRRATGISGKNRAASKDYFRCAGGEESVDRHTSNDTTASGKSGKNRAGSKNRSSGDEESVDRKVSKDTIVTVASEVSVRSVLSRVSKASQHSIRVGAHFWVHWFGARRFDYDPDQMDAEELLGHEAMSSRELVRELARENFKRRNPSKERATGPAPSGPPATLPKLPNAMPDEEEAQGSPATASTQTPTSISSVVPRSPHAEGESSPSGRRRLSRVSERSEEEPVPSKSQTGLAEDRPRRRVSVSSYQSVLEYAEDLAGEALERAQSYLMDAQVSGKEEDLVSQYWPAFTVLQALACTTIWAVYLILEPQRFGGLESSFPGQTLFVLHRDCSDHRQELWRWLTYQFTHGGISHLAVNNLILLIAGSPLEGFHGHWRIVAIFNLGVIGGALFHGTIFAHTAGLAGMSAGCYSLLAMHWGDLAMNWRRSRFRYLKVLLLIFLIALDVTLVLLQSAMKPQDSVVSHASHIGGFTTGLLVSILFVRNLKVTRHKRLGKATAAMLLVAIVAFGGAWLAQWPPKALFESTAWCWARQANNVTVFGDRMWHCIRCQDTACIRRWTSRESSLLTVDHTWCNDAGRWA